MEKIKVLFVCMGNICRSPSAEIVFKYFVEQKGLIDNFEIDSAGTIGYHEGERADARMRTHAAARGYNITHIARKFNPSKDFERFDYIITMDDSNYSDVLSSDTKNNYSDKIKKMSDFASDKSVSEIPDPYYGGTEGFEHVLDLLEDTCNNLLSFIQNEKSQ